MAWKTFSLRTKLLSLVTGMLLLVGGGTLWMFNSHVRKTAREDAVTQAQRIVDLAESVREGMENKWNSGVFDVPQLAEWSNKGETDKVLAAVPIVSAWEAAMRGATDGGYEFRTPRSHARNPNNEPDEVESQALAHFESDPTANEYTYIDKEHNSIRYFRPIRLSDNCMMCHGDPKESFALWGNEDGVDGTGFEMDGAKAGDLHGAFEVIQSMDAADAAAGAAVRTGSFTVLGILVVSCGLLAWLLDRLLIRPLGNATNAFSRLVDGDLTHELEVTSQDEVGQVQDGTNSLIQRLRTLVTDLRTQGNDLNEVSSTLAQTADSVDSAVTETKQRSETVAAAAEEMSVSMQDMKTSLDSVSANVQTVAAATSQVTNNAADVSRTTDEAAEIATRAREIAEQGGNNIRTLETAIVDISKIVEVIQDIAEQTNLLALNATIESSRAGEAGKGFAVVAEEVKTLARQTADATANIGQQIESIQRLATSAVDSIDQIVDVAGEVSSKTGTISHTVEEQKQAIGSLSSQLQDISQTTETLTVAVRETVTAAAEVSQQVTQVEVVANNTGREAKTNRDASQQVQEMTTKLDHLLGDFNL